jgi:hypothetical protein
MEQQVNDVPIVEAFAVPTGAANLSLPLEVTPAPTITVRYFFKTPTEIESTTPVLLFSTLMRKAEYLNFLIPTTILTACLTAPARMK